MLDVCGHTLAPKRTKASVTVARRFGVRRARSLREYSSSQSNYGNGAGNRIVRLEIWLGSATERPSGSAVDVSDEVPGTGRRGSENVTRGQHYG
jgi:hypothetical protein